MTKKQHLIITGVFVLLFLGMFFGTRVTKAFHSCAPAERSSACRMYFNSTGSQQWQCCDYPEVCDTSGNGMGCVTSNVPITSGVVTNPVVGNLGGQSGVSMAQNLITKLITFGFVIGAVIFFFMLLTGAIQWIASGGDKGAIEAAKGKITNAFIGLLLLFAVFIIVEAIGTFFNVSLLTLTIPSL